VVTRNEINYNTIAVILRVAHKNWDCQSLYLLAIIVTAESYLKIEYTIWLSKGDY